MEVKITIPELSKEALESILNPYLKGAKPQSRLKSLVCCEIQNPQKAFVYFVRGGK